MTREAADHVAVSPCFETVYPHELRGEEERLVAMRREQVGLDGNGPPRIGVALSGGGIRSATFSLGVFQALARAGRLAAVDFLSTVSGGGYFGAFLGGLYVPRHARRGDVGRVLADPHSAPVEWLRQNGRYLAPGGSGDALVGAATYLRNLVSVHVLMALLFLTLALAAFVVRAACWQTGWSAPVEEALIGFAGHGLWASPFLILPLATLVFAVVPLGWAYWLMPAQSGGVGVLPILTTLLVAAGSLLARWLAGLWWAWVPAVVALEVIAVAVVAAVYASSRRSNATMVKARFARSRLSVWLGRALAVMAILLAFGVIDSLGQTLWAVVIGLLRRPGPAWTMWSAWKLLPATIIPLGPGIARFLFERRAGRDARPTVRVSLLAAVAAAFVLATHGTFLAVLAHAIGWSLARPEVAGIVGDRLLGVAGYPDSIQGLPSAGPPATVLATLAVLTVLLGRGWTFLNLSTLQTLYAGRITRAYLGASNARRRRLRNRRLSDPVSGDDMELADYRPYDHGGPLHLLNVTINETVSGETQTEYRDRKGIGMAIGPAGLSAGASHHALWDAGAASTPRRRPRSLTAWLRAGWPVMMVRPIWPRGVQPGSRFHLFYQKHAATTGVERLPLGAWVGISGAAFSTGVGYRTSIALSVLAGFFNLRLGYWWDSGVDPRRRARATPPGTLGRLGDLVAKLLPVQSSLLDEWTARFRGPARERWNLSDGGHFENTGAYELLRRRLPLVVVLDNGEDRDYGFGDLAGLVRKARLDFGATIEFPGRSAASQIPNWLRALLAPGAMRWLGGLDEIGPRIDGPFGTRVGSAHAAIGRVTYDDSPEPSWLLVVKPSLTGDEPLDVVEYGRAHPAFPQEPTTDQFFGEAQWESHRRLGEHVGAKLFASAG
jgi:hypothetical protein